MFLGILSMLLWVPAQRHLMFSLVEGEVEEIWRWQPSSEIVVYKVRERRKNPRPHFSSHPSIITDIRKVADKGVHKPVGRPDMNDRSWSPESGRCSNGHL